MSRRWRAVAIAGLCVAAFAPSGCGPQFGTMLYFLTPPKKEQVKAKFVPTQDTLLILFDESPALDLPPELGDQLVRALMDEFGRVGINKKVVPPERIAELRRKENNFYRRDGRPYGIREVGRMADAAQVLWVYPREFTMADLPEQAVDPAKFTVLLKIINAKAEKSEDLRLWPVSEEGEPVTITVDAHDVRKMNSPQELTKRMTSEMAVEIGHLFHDYEIVHD